MWHYTKTKSRKNKLNNDGSNNCLKQTICGIFRLNFTISVILISLFTILILNKLNTIQHNIEEESIKADIQQIRIQIAENWISHNIGNKVGGAQALENGNPILVILEKPKNYIGEFDNLPENKVSIWFFNTRLKQLIYIKKNGEQAQFKLSKVQKNTQDSKAIPMGGVDLIAVK